MESTALLSTTEARKLTNEELGIVQRRVNEIVRRVEEGTLPVAWVHTELQRVVEGKKEPPPPVQASRTLPERTFVRPNTRERKKSRAPERLRTAFFLNRLEFPQRTNEHLMMEMWEAENIPHRCSNGGRTCIDAIMHGEEITERDVRVVNSTMQWLGTNVGSCFLRNFVLTAKIM